MELNQIEFNSVLNFIQSSSDIPVNFKFWFISS